MKWKSRQRQLALLKTKYAKNPYVVPFPNLREGLRPVAPTSDRLTPMGAPLPIRAPRLTVPLVVDCLHKSSMQVILPSEIHMIGRKP